MSSDLLLNAAVNAAEFQPPVDASAVNLFANGYNIRGSNPPPPPPPPQYPPLLNIASVLFMYDAPPAPAPYPNPDSPYPVLVLLLYALGSSPLPP